LLPPPKTVIVGLMGRASFVVASLAAHAIAITALELTPLRFVVDPAPRALAVAGELITVDPAPALPMARTGSTPPESRRSPVNIEDPPPVPRTPPQTAAASLARLDREAAPHGNEASPALGTERTLFGTVPLRALLLALSADPAWQAETPGVERVRYALRDSASSPHVTVDVVVGNSERLRHLIEVFLSQAATRAVPDLAGVIELEVRDDDVVDGVFLIHCDEDARTGYVHFTQGRRLTLREVAAHR